MSDPRDAQWFLDRFPSEEVLRSALKGDPVERLLGVAANRAIVVIEPDVVPKPESEAVAVREALDLAVRTARRLAEEGPEAQINDEEKAALDLFVLLVARPAIFVQNGRIAERPQNWGEVARDRDLLPEIIAGVGRLQTSAGAGKGTGFLVASRRILTNNHVVCALLGLPLTSWSTAPETFAERCDEANDAWGADASSSPVFELRGEFGSTETSTSRVRRIHGHHLNVDMAMLELDGDPGGSQVLPVCASEPAAFRGRRIYGVGYPMQAPPGTPAHILDRVFGADRASLGTKRFSPGLVTDWSGSDNFTHDASTLPGSSGSAIVDFEDRCVVGLHFSGAYKTNNFAVPLFKFRNDPLLGEVAFP